MSQVQFLRCRVMKRCIYLREQHPPDTWLDSKSLRCFVPLFFSFFVSFFTGTRFFEDSIQPSRRKVWFWSLTSWRNRTNSETFGPKRPCAKMFYYALRFWAGLARTILSLLLIRSYRYVYWDFGCYEKARERMNLEVWNRVPKNRRDFCENTNDRVLHRLRGQLRRESIRSTPKRLGINSPDLECIPFFFLLFCVSTRVTSSKWALSNQHTYYRCWSVFPLISPFGLFRALSSFKLVMFPHMEGDGEWQVRPHVIGEKGCGEAGKSLKLSRLCRRRGLAVGNADGIWPLLPFCATRGSFGFCITVNI